MGSDSRREFSEAQLQQGAEAGVITDAMREGRRRVKASAIDDLPGHISKDRDDAITVNATPSEDGYEVRVTIADVAAHIPAGSPLAAVASQRGYSVYYGGYDKEDQESVSASYDPMFPRETEERMELMHDQERAGLSVVMTLDKGFHLKHTRFEPVLVTPESLTYRDTDARMREGGDLEMLQFIARGLKQAGEAQSSWKEEAKQRRILSDDPHQIGASKVVETYMLLANQAAAGFFEQAQLPFVYRNFDETHTGPSGTMRAYYSTIATRHEGFPGDKPYAHVTSPLRRGADYFCQHQQHYVIDVIRETAKVMAPDDPQKAEAVLWQNGPDFFVALQYGRGQEFLRARATEAGIAVTTGQVQDAVQAALEIMPPLNARELTGHVQELNRLSDILDMQQVITQVTSVSPQVLPSMEPVHFSAHLRRAARLTHEVKEKSAQLLPDAFFAEAKTRIADGRIRAEHDGLSIMLLADHSRDLRWLDVKKQMARYLKPHHGAVSGIFQMATQQGAFREDALRIIKTGIGIEHRSDVRDAPPERSLAAAIVTLQDGDKTLAARDYSIGKNIRAAESHAKYSFIEHVAFNDLHPVEQAHLPNVLYAQMDEEHVPREALLEEMAAQHGAKPKFTHREYADGRHQMRLLVSGGNMKPVMVAATEMTEQEARATVMRRMLRHPSFKHQTAYRLPESIYEEMHPMQRLKRKAAQKGWALTEQKEYTRRSYREMHQMVLEMHHEETGELLRFEAYAPTQQRAEDDVAVEALRHMGWARNIDQPHSWVRDVDTSAAERLRPLPEVTHSGGIS